MSSSVASFRRLVLRSRTRAALAALVGFACLSGACAPDDEELTGEDSAAQSLPGQPWDDSREQRMENGDAVDARAGGPAKPKSAPSTLAGAPAEEAGEEDAPAAAAAAGGARSLAGRPSYTLGPGARASSLGTASEAFPVVGAQLVDGELYLVSRNLTPTKLVAFNVATKRISAGGDVAIPEGVGAWGMASPNSRELYIGQYGAPRRGNLFRLDPRQRPLAPRAVAALDALYIWDLDAASDGVVYGVASRENGSNFVFDYDPKTNRASDLALLAPGERVRSVAANESYVYWGGTSSSGAILRATNRATRQTVRLFHTQLDDDQTVYTLRRTGSMLAAGTSGPADGRAALAVINLRTNQARFVRAGRASDRGLDRAQLIDSIAISGEDVYFAARPSGTVYRYDFSSNTTTALGTPVARSETRGMFMSRGLLVGASAEGTVWTYNPANGERRRYRVIDAGAVRSGELAQSIVSDGTRVYVGGNFGVQARDLRTRATYNFFVPGEPKEMTVAEGKVYMAMYPVGELWAHTPGRTNAEPVVQFPPGQNRPHVVRYGAAERALFVGTASDGRGGGAVIRYDLARRRLSSRVDPFVNGAGDTSGRQSVTSLAYANGVVYIGGGSNAHARIAALDATTLDEVWGLDDPIPNGGALAGLEVRSGKLYGYTASGTFVIVDIARRRVETVRADAAGGGRLTLAGGRLYGVNETTLRRFDLTTGRSTVIADNLASALWGWPCIGGETNGDVYVVERTNLLRVSP